MEKELEALIKKALSEDSSDKEKEKKESIFTDEEREFIYKDEGGDYQEPWQKIHQK